MKNCVLIHACFWKICTQKREEKTDSSGR